MAELPIPQQRRDKLEALRKLGVDLYPTRYDRTHSVTHVVDEFSPRSAEELEEAAPRVQVAGRLVALRGHGKTAFAHLSDGASRLQVYIRKDTVESPGFEIARGR